MDERISLTSGRDDIIFILLQDGRITRGCDIVSLPITRGLVDVLHVDSSLSWDENGVTGIVACFSSTV